MWLLLLLTLLTVGLARPAHSRIVEADRGTGSQDATPSTGVRVPPALFGMQVRSISDAVPPSLRAGAIRMLSSWMSGAWWQGCRRSAASPLAGCDATDAFSSSCTPPNAR